MIISKQRKLTQKEEENLNLIDQLITKIILKVENKINNQQHNSPSSPALHDAIKIVSIWKSILSQLKNKLLFQKQINFYLSSISFPISIEWSIFANIKRDLRQTQPHLWKNKTNSKELRTQHLMQQASVMKNENRLTSPLTIVKIQKIEQIIIIWNKIKYLTSDNKNPPYKQLTS